MRIKTPLNKTAKENSEAMFMHDLVNIVTALSLTFNELKPSLSHLPLEEKNTIQNLIALIRRLEVHVGKKLL